MSCASCFWAPSVTSLTHLDAARCGVVAAADLWRNHGDDFCVQRLTEAVDHYRAVRDAETNVSNARARLRVVDPQATPPAPATEPSPDTARAVAEACGDDDFPW